ncbi:MAG: peptidyl-tRNA hydrolase [Planctomycetes bacterium]|nr:peptidyl-tRNA hydrolase [Planctomycetota bacterium]
MWKKLFQSGSIKANTNTSSAPAQVKQIKGESVQYLIVRQDLQMSPGKMAAQSAHAAVASSMVFFSASRRIINPQSIEKYREAAEHWMGSSFAKVILRVKNREQMIKLFKDLDECELPYAPIFDACRTELEPEEANGSTLTCCGIVPIFRSEAPKCLQKLQVYK